MLFFTSDVSDIKIKDTSLRSCAIYPGCFPIFHNLSAERCLDILVLMNQLSSDVADPFFAPSAISQIERVLRIAKAYHQTPLGVKYEIETGGCTVDSPEWVMRMCNNPDALYAAITELTDCLDNDEALRLQLYTLDLKTAIAGCLEDWKTLMESEETASLVCSTINKFLVIFTDHPEILMRFGQGRSSDK